MGESISLTGEIIRVTSGHKPGDIANEIEMGGSVSIQALVYDRKATIEYLTTIFREKLLLGTDKELAIHEDTLRLTNIISREP